MTLLAYAVRRTIGAAIVFLIVVLLTMFAVGTWGFRAAIRKRPDSRFRQPVVRTVGEFPMYALTVLGLARLDDRVRLAARR